MSEEFWWWERFSCTLFFCNVLCFGFCKIIFEIDAETTPFCVCYYLLLLRGPLVQNTRYLDYLPAAVLLKKLGDPVLLILSRTAIWSTSWLILVSKLASEPNNGCRCFYLAQAYSVASKFPEAYLLFNRSEQRADSASKKISFDKVLHSKIASDNFY
jgi:hypothetical protein